MTCFTSKNAVEIQVYLLYTIVIKNPKGEIVMGLFSKKVCSICGGESGFIMNQALLDGNVCKECRKGFSPFFTADRKMPVAYVIEHLKYREANRELRDSFRPNVAVGKDHMLYIDTNRGLYALATESELRNAGFDVFYLADFVSANFFVKESEHYDREDHSKDYFYYDFNIVIRQNHHTLPELSYKVNGSTVRIDRQPIHPGQAEQLYHGGGFTIFGNMTSSERRNIDRYMDYYSVMMDMINTLSRYASSGVRPAPAAPDPTRSFGNPAPAVNMPVNGAANTSASSAPKFCPNCGTAVKPGAKFCIECGTKF